MNAIDWAKEFIGAGGTREQWLAAFDHASKQMRSRSTKDALSEKDLIAGVDLAPQTNRSGGSLIQDVPRDRIFVAPPAATEPSPGRRAAAGAVANHVAKTVLDKIKTHDGRAWGDVGAHELNDMQRDGALAQAIKNKIGVLTNEQRFKSVRELLKPAEFEAIFATVKGLANAA